MRRRWQIFVVLLAWCVGTGSQWDALQILAWGRMFADYSHTMTSSEAFESALYGKPCNLCLIVTKARAKEDSGATEVKSFQQKIVFFVKIEDVLPELRMEPQTFHSMVTRAAGRDLAEPPTPPPRVGVA